MGAAGAYLYCWSPAEVFESISRSWAANSPEDEQSKTPDDMYESKRSG
jgi:hypothetical protein